MEHFNQLFVEGNAQTVDEVLLAVGQMIEALYVNAQSVDAGGDVAVVGYQAVYVLTGHAHHGAPQQFRRRLGQIVRQFKHA